MVPEGWRRTQLADVAKSYSGGTPSRQKPEYFGGDIPWVKSGEVNAGRVRITEETITPSGLKASSAKWVPRGAVLLAMYGATAGKVALLEIDATINQAILAVLGDSESTTSAFLLHALQAATPDLIKRVQGSGQPNLSATLVKTMELPLPPLPEQRKIAAILTAVDETIERTTAVIEQLKVVKKAMMQELLTRGLPGCHTRFKKTEIGEIPEEWEVVRLSTVARIADPNPSHRYPPDHEGGVPLVSTANFLNDDDFSFEKCQRVPETTYDEQYERCQFEPSDVVFARKGRIGFARPYGTARKAFSHTVVLMKGEATFRSEFLLWVVRSPFFLEYLERTMNSNSGVPTLGVKQLGASPVPLPPTHEQEQIARQLSALSRRLDAERATVEQQRSVKSALMSVLLTGELRVTPDEDAA